MDLIAVAAAVGVGVLINLIASELFAWGPRLSEWLMRRAVQRLAPGLMQERMQEEWARHLQTIPPGLWRIVAAVGFYLAARQINVALRVRERGEKAEENTGRMATTKMEKRRSAASMTERVVSITRVPSMTEGAFRAKVIMN